MENLKVKEHINSIEGAFLEYFDNFEALFLKFHETKIEKYETIDESCKYCDSKLKNIVLKQQVPEIQKLKYTKICVFCFPEFKNSLGLNKKK